MRTDSSLRAPRRSTGALRACVFALLALGLAVVGCGEGSGEKVVAGGSRSQDVANEASGESSGSNSGADKPASPVTGSSLEFRPVLSLSEPGSTVTTVTGSTGPEGALAASDPINNVSYLLGPVVIDATQIDSATFRDGRFGEWRLGLVLAEGPEGIDSFNAMAQRCFDATPECPELGNGKGQIAIVLDGDVISAPTINVPSFERDQIEVGGDASIAQSAKALAEAINRS
ncbi:MAG: hypothetical protein WBA45_17275 [Microthrixaceae bacterium]